MKRIFNDGKTSLQHKKIKDMYYKGFDIEYDFYGNKEYTIFYNGDDIIFYTLEDAKKFIDEQVKLKTFDSSTKNAKNSMKLLLLDAKAKLTSNIKTLKDSLFKSAVVIDESIDLTKKPKSLAGQLALNRAKLYNTKNFKELYDVVIEILDNPIIAKQPGVEKAKYAINNMKERYYNLNQNSSYAMKGYENLLRYIVNIQLVGSDPSLSITKLEKDIGNDKYKKYDY